MVRKLIVEVVEARDLMPKDGTGTSSPYVVVDFDGQRKRTLTIPRDLNPAWNEVLEFSVSGSLDMAGDPLEVDVFHDRRVGPSRRNNFLGRVRLDSRHFVRKGEEALIHFPLEKKSWLNWVKGDIGLRIYYVDVEPEPEPAPTEEPPAATAAPPSQSSAAETPAPPPAGESPAADAEKPEHPSAAPAVEPEAPPPGNDSTAEKPSETEPPAPAPEEQNVTADKADVADPPAAEAPPPAEPTLPPEPEKEPAAPNPIPQPAPERAPEPVERSSFDLVDKMHYLFVRVVRARSLPGDAKPHVRLEAFGRHVSSRTARRSAFFEWNQTFAFARDAAVGDTSRLEVSLWDLPPNSDVTSAGDRQFLGGLCFDVSEVPIRDPPDSPLAPQWYRLEGSGAHNGDLMLATWTGTQADESFHDAVKVDAKSCHVSSRSKVYLSPKLWYLRATVIEGHDTLTSVREYSGGIFVRATLGFQVLKTRPTISRNGAPSWNEDLIFVVAEPLGEEESVNFSLELRHGNVTAVLGTAGIFLSSVERRVDDRKVASRWLDLAPGGKKAGRVSGGRLHVRICLDGGYHVADEPPQHASDFRPSARQLWKPPIGAVELGIVGCKNLLPIRTVDGKGTTDAYAVAKYGPKWARTRTVPDSFDPAWNEQYTWPVYDPCTVLTVGVFDDPDGSKDATSHPMGKIRIRISTLESNRGYRALYPLILMLPSGAKRFGEIEIAVRFSRAVSSLDLLHVYGQPTLPAMHHHRPIAALQRDPLRQAAARIVAAHLARSEPSMRREVVLWMLDAGEPRGFGMRRVRANWHRITSALAWVTDVARWVEDTRTWRNPTATTVAHAVLVLLVWFPELIVPAVAFHLSAVGLWRYRRRVRGPAAGPCVRLSCAEVADRAELDEEFDAVPSGRGPETVRARYDRGRVVGARVQGMLGDVAAQAERLQALVSWRDPRATGLFVAMCFAVAVVLYLVPVKMVAVVAGFYFLRHPMFRDRRPAAAVNFFRRLPSLSDRII